MAALNSVVATYDLPTGRRLTAFAAARKACAAAGRTDLVAHLDRFLAHDSHTLDLEREWTRQKNRAPPNPGVAVALDAEIDRMLAGLFGMLSGIADGKLAGQPVEAAARVRERVFPAGLRGLAGLTHSEQAQHVQSALEDLARPAHVPHVTALQLKPALDELAAANARMLDLVTDAAAKPAVAWTTVQDAQQTGISHLREFVARVLGHHPTDKAEDIAARGVFLEEVFAQGQEYSDAFKRRRGPTDVNPTTGEPVEPVTG